MHVYSEQTLRPRLGLALLGFGLVACSDGGSSDSPASMDVQLQTLAGSVTGSGGEALPGVTVRFEGTETVTNGDGLFILPDIGAVPTGTRLVEIDGTTAGGPGTFPVLQLGVEVLGPDADLVLPRRVTLPDLSGTGSVSQMVAASPAGVIDQAIDLDGPDGDIALDGPGGTVIFLGEVPADGPLVLNATPVSPGDIPLPLPEGLLGSSFVTIQPSNARFASPAGGGLDVLLPNDLNLPTGSIVDIWSYDNDLGVWVDRTDETGNNGVVVELESGATAIAASGVVSEGGCYAPVVPIDPNLATTAEGIVLDDLGEPLANVSLSTNFGQFATSGPDGRYSLTGIPAFDLSNPMTPVATDFAVTAIAPPTLGVIPAASTTTFSGEVVAGGVTAVGDLELVVPGTGCLSGRVIGATDASLGTLELSGPVNLVLTPEPNGSFFDCSLLPGTYAASFEFPGKGSEASAGFDVVAGEVSSVILQQAIGTGSELITVNVFRRSSGALPGAAPVDGAMVLLMGSDSGSAGGLVQRTDGLGQATFEAVDPPFTVTAVASFSSLGQVPGGVFRQATSVVGLDPVGDQIGLLLNLDELDGPATPSTEATLTGTITGVLDDCALDLRVTNREFADGGSTFSRVSLGNTNGYSIAVPAGQTLDLFLALDCTTNPSAFGYELGLAPLAEGETRTLDLDVSAGLAVLDQTAVLSASSVESPSIASYNLDLEQVGEGGQFESDLTIGFGFSEDFPITMLLPDFSQEPSNALDSVLELESSYGDAGTARTQGVRSRLTSTPEELLADLPASSSLVAPGIPMTFEQGQFQGQEFFFTAAGGSNGVNLFQVNRLFSPFATEGSSESQALAEGSGPLLIDWTIWTAPGITSLPIPPAPLTILAPGEYGAEFAALRFQGVGTSLADLFDIQVNENLNSLLSQFSTFQTGKVEFPFDIEASRP